MHADAARTRHAAVAALSKSQSQRTTPMKLAEFIRLRSFEDPFMLSGEKWQFVTVKRADGAEDIGVYRFSTDLCHEYADFRAMFNLA